MEKEYNFHKTCPSIQDYETYLNKSGDTIFLEAFKQHLENCELCREAINGYETAEIKNIKTLMQEVSNSFITKQIKPKWFNKRIIRYAASILILVGVSSLLLIQQNKILNSQSGNIDYGLLIENTALSNKTLVKKSQEQYIYISSCDKIAYNDQFLSAIELSEKIKTQENIISFRVEVATQDFDCASKIISSIKNQYSVPVLTISNSKGVKKLTSWGGM